MGSRTTDAKRLRDIEDKLRDINGRLALLNRILEGDERNPDKEYAGGLTGRDLIDERDGLQQDKELLENKKSYILSQY